MKILIADSIVASVVEKLIKDFKVVEQHYSPSELLKKSENIMRLLCEVPQNCPVKQLKMVHN